jgi:hypothetical protein
LHNIEISSNRIEGVVDDFMELDYTSYNVRAFDNVGVSSSASGFSVQPGYCGPIYYVRNVGLAVEGGTFKLHTVYCSIFGTRPSAQIEWAARRTRRERWAGGKRTRARGGIAAANGRAQVGKCERDIRHAKNKHFKQSNRTIISRSPFQTHSTA